MIRVVMCAAIACASVRAAASPANDLRYANAAATLGDWPRVAALVDPLLGPSAALASVELAEAHRLAGLAAFFAGNAAGAETHFVAYLKLDVDGHLDPSLYPPEVVGFFDDVRARHATELRALHPPQRHYAILAPIPFVSQIQNGDTTKAWVIGGLLVATLATNITTYVVLGSWCSDAGSTCDKSGVDHTNSAHHLETINVLAGLGFILTAAYGVYDGVSGYRRRTHEAWGLQPMAMSPLNERHVDRLSSLALGVQAVVRF